MLRLKCFKLYCCGLFEILILVVATMDDVDGDDMNANDECGVLLGAKLRQKDDQRSAK